MDGLWSDVFTKSMDKKTFTKAVAFNINNKQRLNFWFTLCNTISQFSHHSMVVLFNTKPVSTYC